MSSVDVPQFELVTIDLDPAAALAADVRHRRRFAASVANLDEAALATPSRCSLWSIADVLRHCADVDEWMHGLWSGNPPFTSFNPITTPHEFVVTGRAISDTQARDRYVASTEEMAAELENSGTDRWGDPSISPLGFVPWWMSAVHVFYDSWMHERDIFLPLGIEPPVEQDEALVVLTYTLAFVGRLSEGPFDEVIAGVRLVIGEGPALASPVRPGDAREAPALIDALSGRGELPDVAGDLSPEVVSTLGILQSFLR